jgi:hypothetical protein
MAAGTPLELLDIASANARVGHPHQNLARLKATDRARLDRSGMSILDHNG